MKTTSVRSRLLLPVFLVTLGLLTCFGALLFWKFRNARPASAIRQLRINEICTVNPGTAIGEATTYEDYIELYNPTDETISLGELCLSDNPRHCDLAPLPDKTIEPHGFLCIYAVGPEGGSPEGQPSVPLSVSEGETITLAWKHQSESGITTSLLVDSVTLPSSIRPGAVYARTGDGGPEFDQLRPTPGSSNQDASSVPEAPVIETASGFYENEVAVTITAKKEMTIRYTLDGSDPTSDSPEYTVPLTLTDPSKNPDQYASRTDITEEDSGYLPPETPVDKAVVLRAAAFDSQGGVSNTVTATYFLDFSEKEGYEDAVTLSLVTDPENLFSSEKGIYVRGALYDNAIDAGLIYNGLPWSFLTDYTNYYLEGRSSERAAHVQLFDASHNLALSQDCGIRIRGNESRHFPQKSFTLFSRKKYGKSTFDPVLFDTDISYPNLILSCSRTLKKAFFFDLVADRDTATQRYLPCQVFLNGEYWGMYYLMEKYSAEYLAGHYDVEQDNTLLIKDTRYVEDGDYEALQNYRDLRDFLSQSDFSDPENYAELLTKMDMQSFIDWMCTNIYIANTDTKPLGGNVLTWQTVTPENDTEGDGRFRWILYDLDDSLGVGTDLATTPAYAFDSFTGHAVYAALGFLDDEPMPALMKNEDFRRQFVLTFLDLANENFRWDRVKALLDQTAEQKPWADKSWDRWNAAPETATFDEELQDLHTFFEHRAEYIIPMLADHFGLEGTLADVTLTSVPADQGSVVLNTITPDLDNADWTGQYYTDYPITLKAEPAEDSEFVRWEITGGEIANGAIENSEIQVKLDGDTRITAVFEKK